MGEIETERVRLILGGWAEGDYGAGAEFFHPDVVFVIGRDFPESGTYSGLAEVVEYTRGFIEPWDRITIAAEELSDLGDAVLAAVLQRGRGSGSGAETEFRYFQVWWFEDGKVRRWENFRTREQALAAAGGA